jgi:hypothetical protein
VENFKDLIKKEEEIAHHEVEPHNRNEVQIKLATELFETLTGETVDFQIHTQRDQVMEYWIEKGYSKAFRNIENSEDFKNHPRFQGDINNITLDDMKFFVKTNKIPE